MIEVKSKLGKKTDEKIGRIFGNAALYVTLLFITLRACDVIDWPWWCVLSPVIATLSFSLLMLAVVGILYADSDRD